MSPDAVFFICTYGILPAWSLLIVAPRWAGTRLIVHAIWIPALLAVAFGWAFLGNPEQPPGASFLTLSGVMALSDSPHLALAGWLHAEVFDLFVGTWLVRDAERLGIAHGWLVPCLLLTMLVGPLGLFLYLAVRLVLRHRITFVEA